MLEMRAKTMNTYVYLIVDESTARPLRINCVGDLDSEGPTLAVYTDKATAASAADTYSACAETNCRVVRTTLKVPS